MPSSHADPVSPKPAQTSGPTPDTPQLVGFVTDPSLDEISGLAVSRRDPDRFWVHNDWPRPAALRALDAQGRALGTLIVDGVRAVDWEDVASYVIDGEPWLLIGDIGDNGGVRKDVEIIALREPPAPAAGTTIHVRPDWRLRFRYPDAPHDAEAFSVDVAAREILVITKRTPVPQVYALPLGPGDGRVQVARHVVDITAIPRPTAQERQASYPAARYGGWPTGMDIDAAGTRAIVLTYRDAWLFTRTRGQDWAKAFASTPQRIVLPPIPQAEAIGFDAEAATFYVSGEHVPAPWLRFEVPRP